MDDPAFKNAFANIRLKHGPQGWFKLSPRQIADEIYREIRAFDAEKERNRGSARPHPLTDEGVDPSGQVNCVNKEPALSTAEAKAEPPCILVVDDDVTARLLAVESLVDDYHVLEAATADEAIAILAENGHVDLVLSDVRMPGTMNGFGLARWVQDHCPGMPVLLVSGDVGNNEEIKDYQSRWPLLAKPYPYERLLGQIASLLRHDCPGDEG
jgi:CheY-like chemotaxis protein